MTNQLSNSKSNLLFVADLPKETTYEDISNLFADYNFQYASLTNSKSSNIWAQVCLEDEESAKRAKHELNGEIIIPKKAQNSIGKPIRICNYEGRNRIQLVEKNYKQSLLVKNLDPKMSQKEFYKLFLQYGEIESAKIEYNENGSSKGFGYIYYSSEESAEKAKECLNNKEFYGKALDIVNLIPSKSKTFNNITLFVMNFPIDFTEKDLRKLFEKYGEIKSVSISKDSYGKSKGFGYVSFGDFESSSKCITDTKLNQISFPGLPKLVVKYAIKKEDRENKKGINNQINYDFLRIQFKLMFSSELILNPIALEKEIRLFIKVVMVQEYTPKDVQIDFPNYRGIVTFLNKRDFDMFFQKYNELCSTKQPEFDCVPIFPIREPPQLINSQIPMPNQFLLPNNPSLIHQQQQMQNFIDEEQRNPQFNGRMQIPFMQSHPHMINGQNPIGMIYDPQIDNYRPPFPPNIQNINSGIFMNNNDNIPNNRSQFENPNFMNYPGFQGQFQGVQMIPNMKIDPMLMYRNNPQGYIQNNSAFQEMQMNLMMSPQMNFMRQNMGSAMQSEEKEQRNLEKLNPIELRSQFNSKEPVQQIYDSREIEDDIAESIYEKVYERYPKDASKITGMIKDMGIQKMNLLISKPDDLKNIIDKAYNMIHNNDKK